MQKRIPALSFIFVVVLLITLFPFFKSKVPQTQKTSQIYDFSKLTPESVTEVVIEHGVDSYSLKKVDSKWKVNDFAADQNAVNQFFTELTTLTVEDLVSKNKDNHASLGLNKELGYQVKIKTSNKELSILFGNSQGTDSVYIKDSTSDLAYLTESSIRNYVSQTVTNWRDKTIVSLKPEDIQKIEVSGTTQNLVLSKNNDQWEAQSGIKKSTVDKEIMKNFLEKFNPLKADTFLNSEEVTQFNTLAKSQLRITKTDNSVIDIPLIKKETVWWVQVPNSESKVSLLLSSLELTPPYSNFIK